MALLEDRDPALQRAAMPLYQRLARAQELLQARWGRVAAVAQLG